MESRNEMRAVILAVLFLSTMPCSAQSASIEKIQTIYDNLRWMSEGLSEAKIDSKWSIIEQSPSVVIITDTRVLALCISSVTECAVGHYSSGGTLYEVFIRPYKVVAKLLDKPQEALRALECYDRLSNPLVGGAAADLFRVCQEMSKVDQEHARLEVLKLRTGAIKRSMLWGSDSRIAHLVFEASSICDAGLNLSGKQVKIPNVSRMFSRIPTVMLQGSQPVSSRYLDFDPESSHWVWNRQEMFPDMPDKWIKKFGETGWTSYMCK